MKIKCYYKLLIFFTIVSCGPGAGDISEDLGNDYMYRGEGSLRYISAQSIFEDGIYPNVTEYNFNENFIIAKQRPSRESIKAFYRIYLINMYDYILHADTISINSKAHILLNKKFIKNSKWNDKLKKQILPKAKINNIDSLNFVIDEIMEEDPFFKDVFSREVNYYIIDKDKRELYGPYNYHEYINKMQNLKIAPTLNFKR